MDAKPDLRNLTLIDNEALARKHAARQAAPKGGTKAIRNRSGTATGNGSPGPASDPDWLLKTNSARIPAEVAAQLRGKNFANFGELRAAIWRAVENNKQLRVPFKAENLALMRRGYAPFAPASQARGARARYEIDHYRELRDGGAPLALDNLVIRTPASHMDKLGRTFNISSGAH